MNSYNFLENTLQWKRYLTFLILLFFISSCTTVNKLNFGGEIEVYRPQQVVLTAKARKVVLVGGCFDILHHGHIQFLKNAKAAGDYLVVALEPDDRIIYSKKRQPTHTQQERAQNLAAIYYVDKILLLDNLNSFDDYNQLVHDVRPNIIAITANDPQIKNKLIQAANVGAKLEIVIERSLSFSSSNISKKNHTTPKN